MPKTYFPPDFKKRVDAVMKDQVPVPVQAWTGDDDSKDSIEEYATQIKTSSTGPSYIDRIKNVDKKAFMKRYGVIFIVIAAILYTTEPNFMVDKYAVISPEDSDEEDEIENRVNYKKLFLISAGIAAVLNVGYEVVTE